MLFFSTKTRDKRSKPIPPRRPASNLEQQLFGKPTLHQAMGDFSVQDWVRSSKELREGCDVRDLSMDTLPSELTASFRAG